MTSKRKNYSKDRRLARRREKNSLISKDIMLGRTARRKYGAGCTHEIPRNKTDAS